MTNHTGKTYNVFTCAHTESRFVWRGADIPEHRESGLDQLPDGEVDPAARLEEYTERIADQPEFVAYLDGNEKLQQIALNNITDRSQIVSSRLSVFSQPAAISHMSRAGKTIRSYLPYVVVSLNRAVENGANLSTVRAALERGGLFVVQRGDDHFAIARAGGHAIKFENLGTANTRASMVTGEAVPALTAAETQAGLRHSVGFFLNSARTWLNTRFEADQTTARANVEGTLRIMRMYLEGVRSNSPDTNLGELLEDLGLPLSTDNTVRFSARSGTGRTLGLQFSGLERGIIRANPTFSLPNEN